MAVSSAAAEPLAAAPSLLLSVLISAGGRPDLLAFQVRALDQLLREAGATFEILVHEDFAHDVPTNVLVAAVRCVGAREAWDRPADNFAAVLPHCRGDYVWALAAGDELETAGLDALLDVLNEGREDIIVCNSRRSDGAVRFTKDFSGPIAVFVQRTGFSHALAGVVLRRSVASIATLDRYVQIARQDAQVAWLIAVGHNRRFRFVSRPLVNPARSVIPQSAMISGPARRGDEDLGRAGQWLSALDALLAEGAITLRQIRFTIGQGDGAREPFVSQVIARLLGQLDDGPEPPSSDEAALFRRWLVMLWPSAVAPAALIDEACAFVAEHEACLLRIVQDSRRGQAARVLADDLRDRIGTLRRELAQTPWYARFHVERLGFYDIYDFDGDWLAAQAGFKDLREALELIDLPSVAPAFLRATTYEELCKAIEAQPLSLQTLAAAALGAGAQRHGETAPSNLPPRIDSIRSLDVEPPLARCEPQSALAHLALEVARQDAQLAELYASWSWRVTEPLRRLAFRWPAPAPAAPLAPTFRMGESLDLSEESADAFLPRGFSSPEAWGRWTDGPLAIFRCRHPIRRASAIFEFWPEMVWPKDGQPCRVSLTVNGGRTSTLTVAAGAPQRLELRPKEMASAELEIMFRPHALKAPTEAPLAERRQLGLGLCTVRVAWTPGD